MTKTMQLRNGYDRSKDPETATYRYMTVHEAKRLSYGQRVPFLANDGTAREVKVNGAPKTWKRSSGVIVSLKYGLYEYAQAGSKDLADRDDVPPLLVRI
jgi:hypothetical protein